MTKAHMQLFAYTLSNEIHETLSECNHLRETILLTPIPPRQELLLRFDADIDRIFWSATMENRSVTRIHLAQVCLTDDGRTHTQEDELLLSYRRILSTVAHAWLAVAAPVSPRTVLEIQDMVAKMIERKNVGLNHALQTELSKSLPYIDASSKDHPITSAALAFLTFTTNTRLSPWTARIVSYLYLFRSGWDVRGMIVPEEGLRKNLESYFQSIEESKRRGNATPFIEVFARGILENLRAIVQRIEQKSLANPISPTTGDLSARQRDILLFLSHPEAQITNKIVQKKYNVSQITASRDLSKLLALGFIVAHGRGRSVSYSRM